MPIDFEVTMNEYLPLRDVVFNTLRRAILRGELKPGERLMEIQLANKLGVSRTPIREAIRKLELEGLVLMIPRKGAALYFSFNRNINRNFAKQPPQKLFRCSGCFKRIYSVKYFQGKII